MFTKPAQIASAEISCTAAEMSTATPQEDDYHSSSDSDFNEELSASSAEEVSSEDELANRRPKGKSRKRKSNFNDDGVEMGSGDEGIIAQGQKKRRKKEKGKKGQAPKDEAEEESEDEAGGIRVRLRNGRGGYVVLKSSCHSKC